MSAAEPDAKETFNKSFSDSNAMFDSEVRNDKTGKWCQRKSLRIIITTRPTGGLLAPIRGSYRPAPKDAGFHFVQAFNAFDSSQPLKGRL